MANNAFSHTGNIFYGSSGTYTVCPIPGTVYNGSLPEERINQPSSPVKDCSEYLGESVSLRASTSNSSGTLLNPVAFALFEWIYKDAGSGWGHRENVFHSYTDNYGASGSEGFIGVGLASQMTGVPYLQYKTIPTTACTSFAAVRILTIDYYDPEAAPSCSFTFSVTLPVELLSFNAQQNKSSIDVNWETASERNSDYFIVERSPDGASFEPIGQINAAGESQSIKKYLLQDRTPLTGMNYYRLRQVDVEGTENLSKIVTVQNGHLNQTQLYPNPTKDYFVLITGNDDEAATSIEVRNSTGNLVYQQSETLANNNTIRVSTEVLTPGVYWVTVIFDNQKSETLRMVKL